MLPNQRNNFGGVDLDLIVTVCDDAAENCPTWFGPEKVVHMSFPDPAGAQGTEEQQLSVFRGVRDDIHARVLAYLDDAG